MSEAPLPAYVDARKAFAQKLSIAGQIELRKLERVAACTAEADGKVNAELSFSTDSAGRRRIRGEVSARLTLVCQRCLEPVAEEIRETVDLVLVPDEAAAEALSTEFDPWITEDHRIFLADLLDEQLLLGMPIVSYHKDGPCSENTRVEVKAEPGTENLGKEEAAEADSSNPFAVLAKLKLD
ncbi:MAG: YceD family protein [Gammaproteobacteria bacterium]|jgi:uncharacterized protein